MNEGVIFKPEAQTSKATLLKQQDVDLRTLWEGNESFLAREVTVQVTRENDGQEQVHILECFVIPVGEHDPELPTITMVTQGGGGSDAYSSAFMAKDVANAFKDIPRDYNVTLIHLPHVIGNPRTDRMKTGAMATSGEVLYEALSGLPDVFGSLDKVVLEGISAGGGEMIALANHLSRAGKLEAVVLGDPAGIHANPELIKNFVLDPVRAFSDHYQKALANIHARENTHTQQLSKMEQLRTKLQAIKEGLKETVAEVLAGMCTPEGRPKSVIDMAKKQLGGAQIKHVKTIATNYNVDTQKSGMAVSDMIVDSTQEARAEITAPVVFSPMIGARVVNALWDGLGPRIKAYATNYTLENFRELLTGQKNPETWDFIDESIGKLVEERLEQLFPNAPVYFVPIDSSSHGRAFSESATFQAKMVRVVDSLLRYPRAHKSPSVTTIL